ncbi:MAG TPA: hypothetical protein VKL99_12060 [Candidatus Angelobacter sp.]|nr:hypothetical protein [Candidatus Angelobacter sp.]
MKDRNLSPLGPIPRRRFLQLSAAVAGCTTISGFAPALSASENCSPPIPSGPFNGSTCPFPIPWLDKNGNHNQSPKENVELSNIFHFKGKIARCAGFTGMGTDNQGNRLAFGTPTTDFSFMSGEYFAARQPQQGIFSHI